MFFSSVDYKGLLQRSKLSNNHRLFECLLFERGFILWGGGEVTSNSSLISLWFFQYGICNGLTVAVISAFLLFFCMQTLIHPCLRQYILLIEFLAGYFLFGFLHYKEAFPVSVSYFAHHIITLSYLSL